MKINLLDQLHYLNQPLPVKMVDFALETLMVAFQGRKIYCSPYTPNASTPNPSIITQERTDHIALRIFAGFSALLTLPLTLPLLAIKWCYKSRIESDLNKIESSLTAFLAPSPASSYVKVANFADPIINMDKKEIHFQDDVDQQDPFERKAFKDKVAKVLHALSNQINASSSSDGKSEKIAWGSYYIGMGQSDIQAMNQDGSYEITESEDLKYGGYQSILTGTIKEEDIVLFDIWTPERKKTCQHMLNET